MFVCGLPGRDEGARSSIFKRGSIVRKSVQGNVPEMFQRRVTNPITLSHGSKKSLEKQAFCHSVSLLVFRLLSSCRQFDSVPGHHQSHRQLVLLYLACLPVSLRALVALFPPYHDLIAATVCMVGVVTGTIEFCELPGKSRRFGFGLIAIPPEGLTLPARAVGPRAVIARHRNLRSKNSAGISSQFVS